MNPVHNIHTLEIKGQHIPLDYLLNGEKVSMILEYVSGFSRAQRFNETNKFKEILSWCLYIQVGNSTVAIQGDIVQCERKSGKKKKGKKLRKKSQVAPQHEPRVNWLAIFAWPLLHLTT